MNDRGRTVSSVARADAGALVAVSVARADLVAVRHRAARLEGDAVAHICVGVGEAIPTVGDRSVAAKAVAGAEPIEARAHSSAVVAHSAVGALDELPLVGEGELGVLDQRVLALGSHGDVMVAHGALQATATYYRQRRLRSLRQDKYYLSAQDSQQHMQL